MKNLILILSLSLATIGASFANHNPESSKVVYKSEHITVSANNSELISLAHFNVEESSIDFETYQEVSFIQIFDDEGNLKFQLPTSSDKVRISKNLFEKGQNRVGFLFSDKSELKFAEVNIK